MRLRLAATMAQCLRKVALAPGSVAAVAAKAPSLPSSSLLASPLVKPWWRTLQGSLALSVPAASLSSRAVREAGRRHMSVAASAAAADAAPEEPVSEGAEGAVAVLEASEGQPEGLAKGKAMTKRVKHIMNLLNEEMVATARGVKNFPEFWPGDVVQLRVEVPENKRRVSIIKGVVIGKRNGGINSTFRIRRIYAGVGVEMVFPLYSPNIKEIVVVQKQKIPARRAKLYYLRDKNPRLCAV